jgi:hypothetical protein
MWVSICCHVAATMIGFAFVFAIARAPSFCLFVLERSPFGSEAIERATFVYVIVLLSTFILLPYCFHLDRELHARTKANGNRGRG